MDYRIASIVQILYNINRGKDQKPLPLNDFLLKFGEQEERKKQTVDQQFKILQLWAAAMADGESNLPKVIEVAPEVVPEKAITVQEQEALYAARVATQSSS